MPSETDTLEQDMLAVFSFKKPDRGAGEMAQQVQGIATQALTPALDPGNQHGKERTAFPELSSDQMTAHHGTPALTRKGGKP